MTTILIKKKDTAGAPAPGDLTNSSGGTEIAVNTATKRIYTKDSGGNVVELGTNATSSTIDQLTVTTSTTLSYGTANQVMYLNGSKLLVGSGNMTFNGTTLTVAGFSNTGNTTLGDAAADTVTVNGTVTSNLIFTDNTYDIGASGATRPRSIYLAGNATIGGLTSGRLTYAGTGGLLQDSANMTYDGTTVKFIGRLYNGDASTFGASTWGMSLGNGGVSANYFKASTTYWQNDAGTQIAQLSAGNLEVAYASDGVGFTAKGSATGTNVDATTSRGGVLNLYNTSATDGNTSTIGFFNSNNLTSSYISGVNVSHSGRTGALVFGVSNGSSPIEGMRLNATGLGIGTSPSQSLDVNGNVIFRMSSSTTSRTLGFTTANGIDGWTIGNGVIASANQFVIYSNTAGAARLLIDSSGNVAIGSSTVYNGGGFGRVLSIYNSSASAVSYANASRQYQAGINSASQFGIYDATASAYRFVVATDGSVGIGDSSPSVRLTVSGPMNVAAANFKSVLSVLSTDALAADTGAGITLGGVFSGSSQTAFAQIAGVKENSTSANYAGALTFYSRPNGGTLYERARITSAGQLVVGATSASSNQSLIQATTGPFPLWSVGSSTGYCQGAIVSASGTDSSPEGRGQGMYLWNQGNNTTWYVGTMYGAADTWAVCRHAAAGFQDDTAQATYAKLIVDSSGKVFIGQTSGTEFFCVTSPNTGNYAANITNSSSVNPNGLVINTPNKAGNAGLYGLTVANSGGNAFAVYTNGTYGTISDLNRKKNVETTRDGYLADLCALRVVKYNWKEQEDDEPKELGFIAQEVEQVFPGLVQTSTRDGVEDNKLIKQPVLIPMLVKAIQELKAEFDAYKASHP